LALDDGRMPKIARIPMFLYNLTAWTGGKRMGGKGERGGKGGRGAGGPKGVEKRFAGEGEAGVR
jgi:hypothetical protein